MSKYDNLLNSDNGIICFEYFINAKGINNVYTSKQDVANLKKNYGLDLYLSPRLLTIELYQGIKVFYVSNE